MNKVFNNLKRYFYTLKYLKLEQWIGRLRRYLPKFKPSLINIPYEIDSPIEWVLFEWKSASLISENKFKFLNEEKVLKNNTWNNKKINKLWLYNLHYFDDLNSYQSSQRTEYHKKFINIWIKNNKSVNTIAWEPYPTSLRIINWIKWIFKGNKLSENMRNSLVVQIRWLMQNIEYDLLGNHLWTNGKALFFAGLFFDSNESNGWKKKGYLILRNQLKEQILLDGGHFERSPMYHSIILEDILDLINITNNFQSFYSDFNKILINKAEKMLFWLDRMTHPDGDICFFNDSTFGIAAKKEDLISYYQKLTSRNFVSISNKKSQYFKSSGFISSYKNKLSCFCDVGSIAPSYMPGHSHAETLSCEISIGLNRVIVNSGISIYENSNQRLFQRSTFSHSTLQINNSNSSDIWSSFRVGRRAKSFLNKINLNGEKDCFSFFHDGYKYLDGSPIHLRTWEISSSSCEIEDYVSGKGLHQLRINFYFAPDLDVYLHEDGVLAIKSFSEKRKDKKLCFIHFDKDLDFDLLPSLYNFGFGQRKKNKMFSIRKYTDLPFRHITKIIIP